MTSAPSYLGALAQFAAHTRFEDLPAGVRESASAVLADCIAVIAAGSREPEMRRLIAIESRRQGDGGPCTIIGTDLRVGARGASFLNGTAGTFLELDEGNRYSRGHPGIHVLPALLAVAEDGRIHGRTFIVALVVGYEVAARIGACCDLLPGVHPHGTWGTVGAAVAVGRACGVDADQMANLISIAAGLNLASSLSALQEGATIRNSFAGVSAMNGLLAYDLMKAGFIGEHDALGSVYNGILAKNLDYAGLTDALGERFEISRNYFKTHACCRYNHAALDALLDGCLPQLGGNAEAAAVRTIEVETYSMAANLTNRSPATPLAAKYSLPFAMATAIACGSTGVEAFSAVSLAHPAIGELMNRVTVREDLAMTARLPHQRMARVTVSTKDGRVAAAEVENSRGDYDRPFSREEMTAKFIALTQPSWTIDTAPLLALIHEVPLMPNVGRLADGLREKTVRWSQSPAEKAVC